MDKMSVENVVIEVTRKCNMACDHCLRGNPQNKEINSEYIDNLFSKIAYIGNLTITGGEPSLVPHKIEDILFYAKKHGVDIGNFYIATNAKQVSDDFMLAIMKLYCYCSDNESSAVNYSNDSYHDPITSQNIKKLSVFSFTAPKYSEDRQFKLRPGEYEINEGRAKENGIGTRKETGINPVYFDMDNYIEEYDGEFRITGEIELYLNCKGNLVCGCDWSYHSQDSKKNIICHVSEFSADSVIKYLSQFNRAEQAA